jgi:signal transduction histidine kinase
LEVDMERPTKQNAVFLVAVAVLSAVLLCLAVLQYRWTQEISKAASVRMQAELQRSMTGFRQDLERDLGEIGFSLRPPRGTRDIAHSQDYIEQLLVWLQTSSRRNLLNAVYVARDVGGKNSRVLKFNPDSEKFEATEWPGSLDRWRTLVPPLREGSPPRLDPRTPGSRGSWPPPPHVNMLILDEAIPALISPIAETDPVSRKFGMSFLIVVLDLQNIREQLFPALVQKQFEVSGRLDFDVAVLGGEPGRPSVIYSSRPGFPGKLPPNADATLSLGGPSAMGADSRPEFFPLQLRLPQLNGPGGEFDDWMRTSGPNSGFHSEGWKLVVEHRRGSLEAAVARLRRRNMAVSFGILFVLAGTLAVLLIATHRARSLAELQMKFVAGVTHELRTPVSVILAASENLKDGFVQHNRRAPQYGELLHRQAKQLMMLIEQVLQFAASHQRRIQFSREPVFAPDVIEEALTNLNNDEVAVVRDYEPDIPLVLADPIALAQCMQNVIGNAIKYSGESRWVRIGISSRYVEGKPQLNIIVEDRGLGIAAEDITHVFEPFYRGAHLASSAIHGTGLGLALAKSIVEEAGGHISVESRRGEGTSVTIRLPAIDEESAHHESLVVLGRERS